jgi:hypothetical protein
MTLTESVDSSNRRTAFDAVWSGFENSSEQGLTRQLVEVAGVTVAISVRGEELRSVVLPPLRRRWVHEEGRPVDAEFRVWWGPLDAAGHLTMPVTGIGFVPRGKATPREDDGITVAYAPDLRMLSMWDRTTQRGVFWIEDIAQLPSWERSAPLVHLFHWCEADRLHPLVHAAAIGREGKGLLLIGAGGAGKSTAALACLEAGFEYVADDYCLVSMVEGPVAHNLYGSGKLTPSSASHLESLRSAKIAIRSEDGKHLLDVGLHRSEQIVASLQLVGVVLPVLGPVPGTPVRTTALAAGRVLIPSTTLQLSALRPASIAVIADVLRSLPIFQLQFGPDRLEAPRQLEALLRELEQSTAVV